MHSVQAFDRKNSITTEVLAEIYSLNLDVFSILIEFLTTKDSGAVLLLSEREILVTFQHEVVDDDEIKFVTSCFLYGNSSRAPR